jgi:Dpy-30 motif
MQACGGTDQTPDEAAALQLQQEIQATQHSLECHQSDVHHLQQLLRKKVLSDILPSVVPAMMALAGTRPEDPVLFLAEQLLAAADEQDAHTIDPYDAPIYAERRHLVAKDIQRAAESKAAAAAKAEREAIARLETESRLTAMLVESMTRHESMLRS